ncbi:hypothetical protein NFI96_024654, partial [Prochilodus magdalenae]
SASMAVNMSGANLALGLVLCALLVPSSQPSSQMLHCHEVRSSFQFLYPGMKWAPETPVSGSDLQVCQPKGLTCCSRKMEERYLLTAKQNMESGLQASSAQLKLLIIQNAALFQADALLEAASVKEAVQFHTLLDFKGEAGSKHMTGLVMVWGGISLKGRTDLYRLDNGTLTAIRYQDEILGPIVRPYAGAVGPEFLLVHNHARPHVARVCRQFLENEGIDTIDWPTGSSKSDTTPLGHYVSVNPTPPGIPPGFLILEYFRGAAEAQMKMKNMDKDSELFIYINAVVVFCPNCMALVKSQLAEPAVFRSKAFDMVLRLGRNSTLAMLKEEFPALGGASSGAVNQLFLDMSLYILGSDANVDDMVTSFFSRLFPLAYRRLLGNGAAPGASEDCLKGAWREGSAFGSYPKLMMTRLSRSLPATRIFLQALNLGIEVVNTTQHLRAGRDCGRALLRLWYCPHCQGLLEARPCKALCLTTMGACLGGAAEVQPHWRSYVEGLGTLDSAMRGEQDMEAVVLRLHVIIKLALKHAVGAKSKVNTQVSGACAHTPQRAARAVASSAEHTLASPVARSPQSSNSDPDQTLVGRRREFIQSLRSFSLFYGGLGEALCNREPSALNSSLCWNGQEMTDKFPGPGLRRAHPHGSETKQKPPEPVISQIIDKLKHINQGRQCITSTKPSLDAGLTCLQSRLVCYDEVHFMTLKYDYCVLVCVRVCVCKDMHICVCSGKHVYRREGRRGRSERQARPPQAPGYGGGPRGPGVWRHEHPAGIPLRIACGNFPYDSNINGPDWRYFGDIWNRNLFLQLAFLQFETPGSRHHSCTEIWLCEFLYKDQLQKKCCVDGGLVSVDDTEPFWYHVCVYTFSSTWQLLRMVTLPEKRWKARPGGGGAKRDPNRQKQGVEDEEGLESGDCDDEDECTGVSGLGPPPRRKRLRIFADLADNLAIDDLTFHELLLTPRLATDSHGGASVRGAAQTTSIRSQVFLLTFIILLLFGLH